MTDRHLESLGPHCRDLALTATAWMDSHWDPAAGLLWIITREPHPNVPAGARPHLVRDSLWYAAGLLLRGGDGDRDRALAIVEAALETQFDAPGTPYHGSFQRAIEEPVPPSEPVLWRHYDPNWREFCGTMLALVLEKFHDALPAELVQRMERALRLAAEGMLARDVSPGYTNIALMSAFLLRYTGDRLDEPAWSTAGEQLGEAVYTLYREPGTFPEFNSP